jgi:myo-inositol-1(or 4)-monophosphatase
MSSPDLDARLTLACAVAREAGDVMLKAYRNRGGAPTHSFKGPHDYLTETDTAVEQLVRARLLREFAEDDFLGEESSGGQSHRTYGRDVWVVDPIDGTSNFARGIPHFCISIAFMRDGQTEIGVVYQPVLDELYVARRGGGATRNGETIRVSGIDTMGQAIIEAGWSTRRPKQAYLDVIRDLYEAGAQVRRAGSGTLGLAYVADGRNDGYCELHINAWDVLAGLLLIQEAGGWTSDFLANDGLRRGNPVLGCTPALAGALTQVMKMRAA